MPAPDDIYKNDVDFTSLALQYPDFSKRLKANRQLDFSDPESVRQLTKSLLHRDFNLRVDLPEDRLCPPVPNRFNYVLFVQRLIDATSPDFRDGFDPERQVIGLDIGTGSSAIYPLLACRQRSGWRFLATEIDEKNFGYATRNIAANSLESRIRLVNTDPSGQTLIPSDDLERFDRIDVLMTNPPFYWSAASLLESAEAKHRPPNSSCTGAAVEMITPGGEVTFVTRLIEESLAPRNRERIQWFSAMLGKMSSVGAVVERLRAAAATAPQPGTAPNYAVAEFVQGQRTRRWCVAWSWHSFHPPTAVARNLGPGSGVEKKWLPAPTEVEFGADGPVDTVVQQLREQISSLNLPSRVDHRVGAVLVMSKLGDVWSRKARRKQQHKAGTGRENGKKAPTAEQDTEMGDADEDSDDSDSDGSEPALVVRIHPRPSAGENKTTVHIRHLQGRDPVLFESFCGWLKRKLSASRPLNGE